MGGLDGVVSLIAGPACQEWKMFQPPWQDVSSPRQLSMK